MGSKLLQEKAVSVVISKPPLIAYLLTSTPSMEARLRSFSAEVAQVSSEFKAATASHRYRQNIVSQLTKCL
jgi:hypothetical protein